MHKHWVMGFGMVTVMAWQVGCDESSMEGDAPAFVEARELVVRSAALGGDFGGFTSPDVMRPADGRGMIYDNGWLTLDITARGPAGWGLLMVELESANLPAPGTTQRFEAGASEVMGCTGGELGRWDIEVQGVVVDVTASPVPDAPDSVAYDIVAHFDEGELTTLVGALVLSIPPSP